MKKGVAISIDSTVVAAKDQVSTDLDREAVILQLKSAVYYGLNETGAGVWSLVRDPQKVWQIRDFLAKQYDVEPGRCEKDLVALLERLAKEGLIEVRNETAA